MRVNVYIRKENEEAWEKIDNKSDWVNERLSTGEVTTLQGRTELCKVHGTPLDDRGKCLQKGCKYS